MANFELLIRKALGSQDANSQAVRNSVYQSSRNALQKIIDSNRSISLEEAISQKQGLENSISRIEAEYLASPSPPAPEPAPEAAPVAEQPFVVPPAGSVQAQAEPAAPQLVSEDDPLYEIQQILTGQDPEPVPIEPVYPIQENQQAPEQAVAIENTEPETNVSDMGSSVAEPNFDTVNAPVQMDSFVENDLDAPQTLNDEIILDEPDQVPLQFQQRRGKQKRWFGWIAFLIILLLLVWLAIYAYRAFLDGSLFGLNESQQTNGGLNEADYISILTPSDSSSLIISGRGTAELVTEQNTNMLRLVSERNSTDLNTPAQPILIRLKPGVLEQIANKTVTVEIFAKSGDSDQAQFSISCNFANNGDCGRKRFVTGIQPQASVFNFKFGDVPDTDAEYFLAINTDTTASSAQSGKGSMLDIIYARLRVN